MQSSIYIRHLSSGQEFAQEADSMVEGSSTIKAAIILLTLQKLKSDGISQWKRLPILPEHLSIGSGKLNWMRKRSLTIRGHIKYIARFSDCVATNVLVDFLGGKDTVNQELAKQGFSSRLEMAPLQFTDQETTMPHVSSSTAREIAQIFELMFNASGVRRYQRFIKHCFSTIDQPWYEDTFKLDAFGQHKIWVKTGSMAEVGPNKDSVMNVVGMLEIGSRRYIFSCLNHVEFGADSTQDDIYATKQQIMQTFTKYLKDLNDKVISTNLHKDS